ncbi:MAG: hypothetical protein JNL64_14525 [Blastocatellia bacterium]|nr:hypothetical protein [Blastocatellia bacterium]
MLDLFEGIDKREDENGTGSNAAWAIALVIIVAMIMGLIHYSGILKQGAEKD